MRRWIALVQRTDGALVDAKEHLNELMAAEDHLSKATTLEQLHYQRGVIDGLKKVLFALERSN